MHVSEKVMSREYNLNGSFCILMDENIQYPTRNIQPMKGGNTYTLELISKVDSKATEGGLSSPPTTEEHRGLERPRAVKIRLLQLHL